MATLVELEDALRNAHSAGDQNAARRLADEIVRVRQQPSPVTSAAPETPATTTPRSNFFVEGTEEHSSYAASSACHSCWRSSASSRA
jgi:hypothetical protein